MADYSIVSRADRLDEYLEIAKEYNVAFEINDFFEPEILDDETKQKELIELYQKKGIPAHSTMHGAFYDVVLFSMDKKIREISMQRMRQSMEIAKKLGVKGVVFHVNHNPCIISDEYTQNVITEVTDYVRTLLMQYPEIDIYMENMFDRTPDVLVAISHNLREYKNYGVCLDWAHASVFGDSLAEWVLKTSKYVKHMHVNDNDLIGDLHLPCGSGKIDWEYFAKCYRKYFTKSRNLIENTEPKGQKESLCYLTKIMEM